MMGLVYGIAGMFGVILLKASAIVVAYLTAIRLPYKRNLKTIAISAIGVMGFLGTATHLLTVWMYG